MKVVIIGMGKIGFKRYEVIKNIPNIKVVAVCDISQEVLHNKEFIKNNIKVYTNYQELLEKEDYDVVFVCTFNNFIPDIVCKSLTFNAHVFAEKPPGCSLQDVYKMEKAQKKSNKILKFGFNHRFHSSVQEAKFVLDNNIIGSPICARGVYGKAGSYDFNKQWRNDSTLSGGGILIDQGIHMIDLVIYFLSPLIEIKSFVANTGWNLTTEDNVVFVAKTEKNQLVTIHSSATSWRHIFNLEIICSEGLISLNGLITSTKSYGEEQITIIRKDLSPQGIIGKPQEKTYYFHEDNSWELEVDEFFHAIKNNNLNNFNGNITDAKNVMKAIENIYNKRF